MKSAIIQLTLLLIALPLLWQCGGSPSKPVYMKDGQQYGTVRGAFRHRWWNYYERGISFSNGKFFAEAVQDFKAAINQRDKDQRMARTYGMHFVDYFPHRELGIVYFETGNLDMAKKELELSLASFPSAKAYFYLDQVRKALIEQSGIPVNPPELVLDFNTREIWTNHDPVIVSGSARDDNYIAEVLVGKMPVFLESAQTLLPFEKALDLDQGSHLVRVTARNLPGKTTEQEIVIHVDREGPVLSLDRLDLDEVLSGKKVVVSGWIQDAAGVLDLYVNGRSIAVEKGSLVPFTVETILQGDTLELTARDELKNTTTAAVSLEQLAGHQQQVLVASADTWPHGLLAAGLFNKAVKDRLPPVVVLKDWTNNETVFLEKAYIEGRVSDENKIRTLTVNTVSLPVPKGQYVFFSHMHPLKQGKNVLTIEATDQDGNAATKTITIFRRIPAARQLKQRLSLCAYAFEHKGIVSPDSLAFHDSLVDAFVNRKRFRMVERNKLGAILEEQHLSRTDLFDQDTAIRLGGLIGAQSILAGSIIETRNGTEVVSRLIDTQTADILSAQDVYKEGSSLSVLNSLAQGMTVKFHRDFPLTEGQVLAIKGNSISTDLGGDVIKLQRRMIIFRDEPAQQTSTGRPVGAENKVLGYARVNQVMSGVSRADCFDGDIGAIKPLDKVIVQ